MLDRQHRLVDDARLNGATPPAPTFFTLGRAFTRLRRDTPWLQAMPYAPVRYPLRYQADAWQRFFRGEAGHPRFKRRGTDSVTIPQDVRIRDGRLHVPKLGWLTLRRRGGSPYPDGVPKQAVLRREGGKWMATVCDAIAAPVRGDNGRAIGLDMNTRQVAVSDGREARLRRAERRIAMLRRTWHHRTGRALADTAGIIVIEDLETSRMTRSAKGTTEEPGRNVQVSIGNYIQ